MKVKEIKNLRTKGKSGQKLTTEEEKILNEFPIFSKNKINDIVLNAQSTFADTQKYNEEIINLITIYLQNILDEKIDDILKK